MVAKRVLGVALVLVAAFGVSFAGTAGATSPATIDSSAKAKDAAKQATVTLADLGAGWTVYRRASGFGKVSAKSCGLRFGSPLGTGDRGYTGPMFEDAAKRSYVYSFAYVFPTEARAKAYTAMRGKPKYIRCQVAGDDAAAKHADRKTFVKVGGSSQPVLGGPNGLEAFYEESAGVKAGDGTDAQTADYVRYTYRHGRVVFLIYVDTGLPQDAAAAEEMTTRLSAALDAGAAAINTRLSTRRF